MDPSENTADFSHLDEVIAAYLRAEEAGEQPDRDEWLLQHADIAAPLRAFFADRQRFEKAAAPLRDALALEGDPTDPSSDAIADSGSAASNALERIRYFGDYEILGEIARGGMGVVYRARQVSLNRQVALKMILAGQLASPADVQRFQTEAEAAANLDHPNIVPIHEVGQHEGQHYFTMKLVEGGSLAGRIPQLLKSPHDAARLLLDIARAVHYAHQRGILHRDLKPANILLETTGRPMVTDFGLAKQVESQGGQTSTGAIIGTPAYMAPEQARGEKDLTTAVDIYSLGAILYELLNGHPPFRGATPVKTLLMVISDEPARPSSALPRGQRDLETIALKCLAKEPSKRYRSAEELADDLQRWLDGLPILARPTSRVEHAVKWVQRHPAIAALIGLVALVAGLGFTGIVWQWREAVAARRYAEEKADAESRAKASAESRLYASRILLAQSALDQGQYGQAGRALQNANDPQRGWEWNYLDARRDASCRAFAFPPIDSWCTWYGDLYYVLDGKAILAVSDNKVQLVDPQTGKVSGQEAYQCQFVHIIAERFPMVALSPDRKTAAIGDNNRGTVIWNLEANKSLVAGPIAAPEHRPGSLSVGSGNIGVNFSSDSRRVVSSLGKTVRVHDTATGKTLEQIEVDTDAVWSVAFSPDGRFVACGCEDRTARVISLETKKEIFRSKKHPNQVNFVAFAPDDKRLISSCGRYNPRLWDLKTGEQMLKLSNADWTATCLALSPDGKQAATAAYDADNTSTDNIHLWDTANGQEIRVLRGHTGCINRVVWSMDGKQLASGGRDKIVKLWDAGSGKLVRNLPGHASDIRALGFSFDGRELATAAESFKIFDLRDRPNPQILRARQGEMAALRFLDNRTLLAAGVDNEWHEKEPNADKARSSLAVFAKHNVRDGIVDLWDTDSGKLLHTLRGHALRVSCMALASDRKWLATGSDDGTVKLWDVSAEALSKLDGPADAGSVEFDKRPDQLLRQTFGATVNRGGDATFDIRKTITAVALTAGARQLIAGTYAEQIEVWDVAAARTVQTLVPLTSDMEQRQRQTGGGPINDLYRPVTLLGTLDNGKLLAAFAGFDCYRGSIQVWDTVTHQAQLSDGFEGRQCGLAAISPDGRWLVWGGQSDPGGNAMMLWDATTLEVAAQFGSYQGVDAFAFSPDSGRLAVSIATRHDGVKTFLNEAKTAWSTAVSYQHDIEIWDIATRTRISRMEGHEGTINCLAWLPDGRRLVSGGRDHTLKMWDVASGQELLSLPLDDSPDSFIKLLAVSPDGHRIAANGRDTITVWDDRTRSVREGWRQVGTK